MTQDLDRLLERMDVRLDRAIEENDPRGYFAAVYRAVTVRVRDGIHAGEFDDGARMERFDVAFAELYLDASDARDRGTPVSASWQVAFDHARSRLIVLQHVLLGMNAHINLDLGVAAARIAPGSEIDALADDFARLDGLLAAMVDRMQDAIAVVSPWTGAVDRVGGRFDELLSSWSVTRARDRAWRFAQALARSPDPDLLVARRDEGVARIGEAIARPRPLVRAFVLLAHLREDHDVGAVVRALRVATAPLAAAVPLDGPASPPPPT